MTPETIVCIIGTPRSGTSLTARVLNLAGVYLGPETEMRPAGRWNPRGFWENRQIGALNRRLLALLRQSGPVTPQETVDWARSEALEAEREEARALIAKTFAGHPLWGWKEAGTTPVLPFWQQILPPMRYVICLRNPVDVATSAERIVAAEGIATIAAWSQHIMTALAHTARQPRLLVAYEDYFDAPDETVERLWRFVGNEGRLGDDNAKRLKAPIDAGLAHHRTPAAKTLRSGNLPLEASSTYLLTELLRRAIPEPWRGGRAPTAMEGAISAHARRTIEE